MRLPLFARASVLLGLNILLLFAALLVFGGWNLLLSEGARARMSVLRQQVLDELSDHAEADWPVILERHSLVHGVRISVTGPKPPVGMDDRSPPPPPHGARPPGPPDHTFGPRPDAPPPNSGGVHDRTRLSTPAWHGPYEIFIPGEVRMDGRRRPMDVVITADHFFQLMAFVGVGDWVVPTLLALALSLIIWAPFLIGTVRSIVRMKQATQRIAAGDFDARVTVTRGDELADLADSINDMAARLAQQVTAQKQFLADVAHETISPVARIRFGLELLGARLDVEPQRLLREVQDDVQLMSSMLEELLMFSRAGHAAERSPPSAIGVHDLVSEAARLESAESQLDLRVAADMQVLAHRDLLLRAVCNLLRNARRHAPQSRIEVSASRVAENRLLLTVADHGAGVPDEALQSLGQPFVRPDPARSNHTGGHGLGLAIVRRCIETCGGQVRFRNRQGGGFEVILDLPVA